MCISGGGKSGGCASKLLMHRRYRAHNSIVIVNIRSSFDASGLLSSEMKKNSFL